MNSTMPILAIFDLDNTLLRGDSDYEMVNYLIDKNFVDEKYREINEDYFNDYGDGNLNIDEFNLYRKLFYSLHKSIVKPDLIIFLKNSIENLKRNIKKRNRFKSI